MGLLVSTTYSFSAWKSTVVVHRHAKKCKQDLWERPGSVAPPLSAFLSPSPERERRVWICGYYVSTLMSRARLVVHPQAAQRRGLNAGLTR